MDNFVHFFGLKAQGRPDIEEDTVPVEPFVGWKLGLVLADCGDRFSKHALQMRQLHNAPRLVAHGSKVAYLCHGEQSLILGIARSRCMQEIYVLHRWQS